MDWERQFLKCAEDRDAALAREAALREELASNVMTIQELAGANADLIQRCNAPREELADTRTTVQRLHEAGEFLDGVNQGIEDDLRKRLTAAEQELANERERFMNTVDQLATSLAAAEHRNAEISASLQLATRLLASGLSALSPRAGLAKNVRAFLDSQRKPTESGASE